MEIQDVIFANSHHLLRKYIFKFLVKCFNPLNINAILVGYSSEVSFSFSPSFSFDVTTATVDGLLENFASLDDAVESNHFMKLLLALSNIVYFPK